MADLKISELPLRTRAPGEASSADPGPGAAVQVRTSSRAATSSAWRSVERRPRAGSRRPSPHVEPRCHVERLASVERPTARAGSAVQVSGDELPLRTRAPGEASSALPPGSAVQGPHVEPRAARRAALRAPGERRAPYCRAGSAVQVRTSSRAAHVERLAKRRAPYPPGAPSKVRTSSRSYPGRHQFLSGLCSGDAAGVRARPPATSPHQPRPTGRAVRHG